MSEIAIFGAGFLGKKLFGHLVSKGHRVGLFSKAQADYDDPFYFKRWINQQQNNGIHYDWFINCCGYTGVPNIDAAEQDRQKCWKLNVEVPHNIAAIGQRVSPKTKMIHISSGCIFNGYEREYDEWAVSDFGMFNPNSSYYSKTKHIAERVLSQYPHVTPFRIRMPFCGEVTRKNYIAKLLMYNNLISLPNSLTCIDDLCELANSWIIRSDKEFMPGPINVVNPGAVEAKYIIERLAAYGVTNPLHQFIKLSELKTKAPRSNCVLKTDRLNMFGLTLPDAKESLESCIKQFAEGWKHKPLIQNVSG